MVNEELGKVAWEKVEVRRDAWDRGCGVNGMLMSVD